MLRYILIYGVIAGAIVGVPLSVLTLTMSGQAMMHYGMLVGYLIMLIALSAVFLAIKRHRDVDLGGVIRFWPALALGLGVSVVAGVISGKRDMDGVSMLQLAIPIEQGNSGGPVLDPQGRVLGIVTMKSLVTANLGFAVPVNALKQIHERPNPITM